ncbi:molybdopterin-guanine dinucleotide biosynthesis protein MobB [Paenibacillus sp. CC-CFT747]|nr:molybdopterin-guanine dinucleotide biosynthesis protein MobB [Paenibacillus sp. CC-CFT747]
MTVPHVAFVGYSGSGKTTVAVQVAARLKAGGLRVGVLKHDVHGMSLGSSGKDTDHYWRSGADRVVLDSPDGLLMLQRPPASSELAAKLAFLTGWMWFSWKGTKGNRSPRFS